LVGGEANDLLRLTTVQPSPATSWRGADEGELMIVVFAGCGTSSTLSVRTFFFVSGADQKPVSTSRSSYNALPRTPAAWLGATNLRYS